MHPYLLIPVITLLASCVVGSGSVARDLAYRPNRVVAAVMACTGAWAVLEIAYTLAPDPEAALRLCRLLGFVYLPLAPLVLELLFRLELLDDARTYLRVRVPLWVATGAVAVAHAVTPWFLSAVVPTDYGWRYVFGPAFWPGVTATIGGCALAALRLMRTSGTDRSHGEAGGLRQLGAAIWVPIVGACLTDVGLPALGLDGPRLAAPSIVLSAGALWVGSLSSGRPDLGAGTLAREFLDRLPDGVAIVRGDGRVRSANERLARILRSEPDSLLGRHVDEWLSVLPSDGDAEVRELRIDTSEGPVAIALWHTPILDLQGAPIGRVVVVRDQQALVELRRRLVGAGQMAALGELAAGIAHEVNNPVAYVIANLNHLRRCLEVIDKALPPDRPGLAAEQRSVDECLVALERMVEFVGEVRSLAYPGGGPRVLCDVNELVEGTLRLAGPKLGGAEPVDFEPSTLTEVRCAPLELKHALLSVLLAAVQEVGEAGGIRIRTAAGERGPEIRLELDRRLDAASLVGEAEMLLAPEPGGRLPGLLIPRHILRQQGGQIRVDRAGAGATRIVVELPGSEP